MSAPNYAPEFRDRQIRLVDDFLADEQLQLSLTACRQIDAGTRPGWHRVGVELVD